MQCSEGNPHTKRDDVKTAPGTALNQADNQPLPIILASLLLLSFSKCSHDSWLGAEIRFIRLHHEPIAAKHLNVTVPTTRATAYLGTASVNLIAL